VRTTEYRSIQQSPGMDRPVELAGEAFETRPSSKIEQDRQGPASE
jgi:hypothetical protein